MFNTIEKTNYIPAKVDEILVPHKAFQNAKERLQHHLLAAQHYKEPTCIAVIGDSRAGKSRLIGNLVKEYTKKRTDEGMEIPILSIRTPSKPTVKGLVETMLREMGDPLWHKRGSEIEKTERLYTLVKQTKTIAVVIDEFQHFYDKVSHKIQHHLSDWLKIFVDRSKLMLIVVGLPACMAVINQNEQLRGRFIAPIYMPRFTWEDKNGRVEFMACLGAFQAALNRFDIVNLSSDEMAFRFYCATGGLIGYIAKILHEACLNAQLSYAENAKLTITLSDLAVAYENALWQDSVVTQINPFDTGFDPTPTNHLIEMAKKIGIASQEETKTRRVSAKYDTPLSSKVLSK
jgi:hypothetical protein